MDLQLSNLISSPIVSARSVVAPGAETQNGKFQADVPADIASENFAKLLARALPRGSSRTIPAALKVTGTDAKDQKFADKTDLPPLTASTLPATVSADDQKTPSPNPHASRDMTEPGIEVAGPIIVNFMPVQQEAGAKTADGTESIDLPAASTITPKSASSTASITDAVVQQSANEAEAPQVHPGFVLQTEYSSTAVAIAIPDKKAIQATTFNTTPMDRVAPMLVPVSTPSEPSPIRLMHISAPLGSHDWNNQLGQQVVWMKSQQNQIAEIRINPPNLGPIELRLTLDQQQAGQNATLHFTSPHAEVREAIENSMPRLRELMAEAGITLGNATVGSESFPRQQAPEQGSPAAKKLTTLSSGKPGAIEAIPPSIGQGSALLDTFA